MDYSRSLEIAPFDTLWAQEFPLAFHLALSFIIFEILNIEQWRVLEIWVNGHSMALQEAQLSLRNRAMLICTVVEVRQDFLSEYVDKKFTYICYRRLTRYEWIYYGSKNCVIYNSYKIV